MQGIGLDLTATRTAPWWPAGAIYAADFVNDRYMRNGVSIAASAAYSFSRASSKLADDSQGVWHSFAPDMLARTDKGALIEPAAENLVANSSFAGGQLSVTNALDGLPTGWDSSKIDGIGVNGRILALDTWMGLPSMTIRLWGNSTVGDAELRPFSWSNHASNVPAVQGDTIAQSLFIQRVGGSNSNFVARLRLNERNSAGTYLLHQTSTFGISDVVTRPFASMTVSSAATAKVTGGLVFAFTGAFDVIIRIAAPETNAAPEGGVSSPILTPATPSRGSDILRLLLPLEAKQLAFQSDLDTQTFIWTGGEFSVDTNLLSERRLRQVSAYPD